MQKIVELNLDEITVVTGGVKTATASVSASATQSTVSASTANLAIIATPTFAVSNQSTATAFRRY